MMDKHYDSKAVEEKWYAWWEQSGCFHAEPGEGGEPYSVVIPPPNVTGILHMGHALNQTIQDVLVRWHRMQGRNVLWVPGTDHAGIATQNVVEKALKKEGKRRQDLGREAFVDRVWEWRRQFGGTIVHQQRKLGNSTDWRRERFTMDEGLSKAVTKVFCDLYNRDLIYRGNYIVNWCPRCETALADDEVEHEPNHGHLWYIRYPVVGREDRLRAPDAKPYEDYIMVATTRPETLPGDTAVAVNPKDERYAHLHGKQVVLPLTGRTIPVVTDDYVEKEFGTGIVKITPAHDPNDFQVGKRHNLEEINVMNGNGTMNVLSGYEGMDRFACREAIIADLEKGGYLDHIEDYDNQVGHCYRCHTVIESRLSKQWFVKMAPLAVPAVQAVKDGTITFHPKRWENLYFNWMENIRDWCISRQIWWGHRIPAYYYGAPDADGERAFVVAETPEKALAMAREKTGDASLTADALVRDEDVLDTWFSSWLWPFTTLGWPERTDDLNFYYPTTDLVTAPDIIFFWVARMIMAGFAFMNRAPFRNVVIHGIVRDDKGRKMSKSLGNSLDPLEIIEKYSADALRFSLALITSLEVDSRVSMEKFEIGRNFGTKIWNAARFIQMQAEKAEGFDFGRYATGGLTLDPALLTDDDRHLLLACGRTADKITAMLEKYRIQDGALAIYDFIWTDFCDWYLEYAKTGLSGEDAARRDQILAILANVFSRALRMLHPYMPFITEELWHQMGFGGEGDSIMKAPWPEAFSDADRAAWGLSDEVAAYVEAKRELITAGRALRSEYNISPSKPAHYVIHAADAAVAEKLAGDRDALKTLLRAEPLDIVSGGEEKAMPGTLCRLGTIYLPLEGLVDIKAEAARVKGELDKARGFLKGVEAKLNNAGFVAKAPAAVVEQQRAKREELLATIAKLEKLHAVFAE
ncbi:MAG: valine--tRNA ligase [Kiritimatiellae bacterium]|nr:valine--tRNA ligase [Kiritimatiellia bacterium]